MIKIEKVRVSGFEEAIRGMRNPYESWEKSDSDGLSIGPKDAELMQDLAKGGPVEAKYRRMIDVWFDITAPLYWWKEFDTYKVGTVANSCSTMHMLHKRDLTLDDFSIEHLRVAGLEAFKRYLEVINIERRAYVGEDADWAKGDKQCWYSMIQLLPSSYNQLRTIKLNYEVLANIYQWRKGHKLDEWKDFCKWIEGLPYSWIII